MAQHFLVLTARERDVLELLVADWSEPDIATSLGVTRHTVNQKVRSAMARNGVTTRLALIRAAEELAWQVLTPAELKSLS